MYFYREQMYNPVIMTLGHVDEKGQKQKILYFVRRVSESS